MSSSIDRLLLSSVGKKIVMALTGFLLVGFLILHLAGNLSLYAGENGETFINYAHGMHELGPLFYVGEVLLFLLFAVHVYMAVRLTRDNSAARPTPYAMKATFGRSSTASRSMFVTGSIVLGFLVVHLMNFRFAESFSAPPEASDLYETVRRVLSNPFYAAIYIAGAVAVAIHLSHGFRSAFQSVGANHPRLNTCVRRLGIALAIAIGFGFLTFPIVALISWKGGP